MERLRARSRLAAATSCAVIGPREAARASTERPEAWTGSPSRCATVGLPVSASTRRVGAVRARTVAIPAASVVRPGAPDVPHTASTDPGGEGGGVGVGGQVGAAGTRGVFVAAMRELTTCSGLPGAATEATPSALSLARSPCGARAITDMPDSRREWMASAVRSGSAPSTTARSATPARAAAITSARSAQRRTMASVSERAWMAWMMGASYRWSARSATPWMVLTATLPGRPPGSRRRSGRRGGPEPSRRRPGSRCVVPGASGRTRH